MVDIPYASVCDGIGAAHEAWSRLGLRCAWTSEIEKTPSAIVEHHWGLPNVGDMTKIQTERVSDEYGRIRLLVGGTPCQSFSVAGLREGLADPRGNLALEFLRLADGLRPDWLVWENVPGCLSSNGGRDFGSILGAMAKLGYGWAYRVFDAQYMRTQSFPHAVPQRRRRVFVVGYLRNSARSAAVLFDRESMQGHRPPGRRSRKGSARDPKACLEQPFEVANTLTRRMYKGINTTIDEGQTPVLVFDPTQITHPANKSNPKPGDPCHTLAKGSHAPVIIHPDERIAFNIHPSTGQGSTLRATEVDIASGINASQSERGVRIVESSDVGKSSRWDLFEGALRIRKLTPLEVERLQGFSDGYTNIKIDGKRISDSARYKALGNSMAVNCMSWIGQRIIEVDQIGES